MLEVKLQISRDTQALNVAVTRRRATRSFCSQPVPEAVLTELLELSMLAPSGYNLQPWRLVVVRDERNRKRLRAAAMDQAKVEEAPVVIIFCADPSAWREDLDHVTAMGKKSGLIPNDEAALKIKRSAVSYLESVDNRIWATKQTMIAFTHLMLLAETYGFDTAPMEGFYEDKVKEAFHIPDRMIVLSLLAIGYRNGHDKKFGGRFDLDRLVSAEDFGTPYKSSFGGGPSGLS